MKKNILFISLLLVFGTNAQVKIGDNHTTVNANSLLELESTDKGLLLPRIALTSTTSASPLAAHVAGMTVYNTATAGSGTNAVVPGIYVNNGTSWVKLNTSDGVESPKALNFAVSGYPSYVAGETKVQYANVTITPSDVVNRVASIEDAEKLAAYFIQKLVTDFKYTENDWMYDQLDNTIIVGSDILSKASAGVTTSRLSTGGIVDMDNSVGSTSITTFGGEYFRVIIGTDGTNIFTMDFNYAILVAAGSPIVYACYQNVRNSTPGANVASVSTSGVNTIVNGSSAPKCTSSTSITGSAVAPLIQYVPVIMSLNK